MLRKRIYNNRQVKKWVMGFLPFYLFTFLPLLTACDNIAEDERLVEVGPVVVPPEPEPTDEIYDAPIAPVAQRVLIEDHTGQRCPNCPQATEIIEAAQAVFGNLIVPVAIHSQQQGIMEPEGLGTALGNTYYNYWGLSYKPAGLVNRLDGGDGVVLDKTIWNFAITYALGMETPLDIRIKAAQDADDATKATIDVKVICTAEDKAASGKLQVWLTEDNIVAEQDNMGTKVSDYVHNHVLRAAVNGDWGEDVSVSGLADTREFHYTATLKSGWKPADLSVVAFVYNGDGVQQAVSRKVRIDN